MMNTLTQDESGPPLCDRDEWQFDRVPAEERLTCILYEYARESASIGSWWRRSYEYTHQARGGSWERPDGRRVSVARNPSLTVAELATFQLRPPRPVRQAEFAGLLARAGAEARPPAWLAQTPPFRRQMAGLIGHDGAVGRGTIVNLARIWFDHQEKEARSFEDRDAPFAEPSVCDPDGREMTVLVIDWANFDNKQIGQDLQRWVHEHRPAAVPEVLRKKAGRGKPTDLTGRLRALAAMRLLGHYKTIEQLAARDQAAWDHFRGRRVEGAGKELRRAQNECFRYFHELFPFEPAAPRSCLRPAWQAWRKSISSE